MTGAFSGTTSNIAKLISLRGTLPGLNGTFKVPLSKDLHIMEYLFAHPTPNFLVVDAANERVGNITSN